jgi:hypothetical protein
MFSATEDIFDGDVFEGFGRVLVERLIGLETELSELVGAQSVYLLFGWMFIRYLQLM